MTVDPRPETQPVDDLYISQAIRDAGAKTHEVLPGTPGGHLAEIAARFPDRPAIEGEGLVLDYAGLDARVNRTARLLTARGLGRGDRMAVLAENRLDYVVLAFAAARTGIILAALNWRLSDGELSHCVHLVAPRLVIASPRFRDTARRLGLDPLVFGPDWEAALSAEEPGPIPSAEAEAEARQEDGLLILYTSGTTGLPKGAMISARAEMARFTLSRRELGLRPEHMFIAWAPMFHMVSIEHAMHVLMTGGRVVVVDGADIPRLVDLVETGPHWWLVLIPGMIERVAAEIRSRRAARPDWRPARIEMVGALADLVPPALIAEISGVLEAPYWNSFGSTETGMLPAAGTRFAPGEAPGDLAKAPNSLHLWRLVDEDDRDVPPGTAGEIAVRGPSVFSGYWNAAATNAKDFRGGWFHMGDMFVERPDGRLDFVDRAKYMIKSGAENIYPVEIERVLMTHPAVGEAVVVRRPDERWGEVPVAFVALADEAPPVTAAELTAWCRAGLATYKCPREIRFVASRDDFPRSTSGKVQRKTLEAQLQAETAPPVARDVVGESAA